MNTKRVKTIAEIGINHNGSIDIAKKLIRIAAVAGCDYVKLQKRTPDIAVPENKKAEPKKVPWRAEPITYLQYKKDIEFSVDEYIQLAEYAQVQGTKLFASVWDVQAAEELAGVMDMVKVPSAKITDLALLRKCRELYPFTIMSTGMSTEEEVNTAIKTLDPDVLLHTNSVYPSPAEDLRFGYIKWLRGRYGLSREVGYSNHYYGTKAIYIALGLGAKWVEFHITLDHTMWGSDQTSSIEPNGLFEVIKAVRDFEYAVADGNEPRTLIPGEEIKRKALR
jgi:N-acetylneuraminate synthase